MANVNALSPGTILNASSTTYKIIRVLGSGGFGITYLVETRIVVGNIEIPAQFAIKEHFISSLCERQDGTQHVTFSEPVGETVKNSRRAFIREAQRLQSLGINHHNIVNINEVFEANNTAYYVMEYLEGETLQQYVARRGALSVDETLSLLRPVIDAVATLHKNNITHYDIKPANIIIVASEDGSPRPVLIDFGLSKHYDESGDGTSSLLSQGYTPGYSPVEQYSGLHKFSPQADVYALAATILYCITGRKPAQASEFDADSLNTSLRGIAPVSLIGILQGGMAYARQQRTPDANTLYDELYNGAPISGIGTVLTNGDDTRPFVPVDTHPIAQTTPISRNAQVRKPQPISQPEDFETEYTTERRSYRWIWITVLALIIIGGGCYLFLKKDAKTEANKTTNDSFKEQSNSEQPSSKEQSNSEQPSSQEDTEMLSTQNEPLTQAIPSEEEIIAAARERYDIVCTFKEDMAKVGKDGKFGFIDHNGKEVVKPTYDYVESFSEGLAEVRIGDWETGKSGFIDKTGKLVIPLKYDYAWSLSDGLAKVKRDHKWGFIDKTGKEVVPIGKYDDAGSFSEGLAIVRKDWKYGFIDKTGKEVVPIGKYDSAESFSEGLAKVRIGNLKDGKSGFVDKTGKLVIPLKYDDAESFSDSLAIVSKDGKYGFIDKTGELVIPLKYDYAWSFSEGMAAVRIGDWETGKEIIPLKYDDAESFSEGLAMVKKDGKSGFIDKTGKVLIPLKYDNAGSFSEGLALVEKDGKTGFIDTAGNVMWLPE